MDSEFSEFQYGYSATSQLENRFKKYLIKPPHLPSLIEEGKVGYDLELPSNGNPIFFQFKLSKYLSQRNAKQWNHYNLPYYRFKIWPKSKSNQHNELISLSQRKLYVFYCSPIFYKRIDYFRFHMSNSILQNSKITPCLMLPRISGNAKHCICYDQNGSNTQFFSKSDKIPDDNDLEGIFGKILEEKEGKMLIDEKFPHRLLDKIKITLFESTSQDDSDDGKYLEFYESYFKIIDDVQSPWEKLNLLINEILGLSWFVLLKPKNKKHS